MTTASYLTVTPEEMAQLRRERVHQLELDHVRTCLLLTEVAATGEEPGMLAQLAEIERRIGVHLVQPQPADDESDEDDDESDESNEDDEDYDDSDWDDEDEDEDDSDKESEPEPEPARNPTGDRTSNEKVTASGTASA